MTRGGVLALEDYLHTLPWGWFVGAGIGTVSGCWWTNGTLSCLGPAHAGQVSEKPHMRSHV